MKLFNIFKKESSEKLLQSSATKIANIQKMDSSQLSKIAGGKDTLGHEVAHIKQESTK